MGKTGNMSKILWYSLAFFKFRQERTKLPGIKNQLPNKTITMRRKKKIHEKNA